jgi:isopentenyl diphosphate isomerase/L-lactate dehydrogenase-like FMN-dependent dehydrogenase
VGHYVLPALEQEEEEVIQLLEVVLKEILCHILLCTVKLIKEIKLFSVVQTLCRTMFFTKIRLQVNC